MARIRATQPKIQMNFTDIVRFAYMGGLSGHLAGWKSIPKYSYVVNSNMPKALEDFGIKETFADSAAKAVLDGAKVGNVHIQEVISDELSKAKWQASANPEKRYADETKDMLMPILTNILGKVGVKALIAKDKPYIYFIKDKTSMDLYGKTGVFEVNPHEEINDTRHLTEISLKRFLYGTLKPERIAVMEDHLKFCKECSELYKKIEEGENDKPIKEGIV